MIENRAFMRVFVAYVVLWLSSLLLLPLLLLL